MGRGRAIARVGETAPALNSLGPIGEWGEIQVPAPHTYRQPDGAAMTDSVQSVETPARRQAPAIHR
jgi:hypothetical protein